MQVYRHLSPLVKFKLVDPPATQAAIHKAVCDLPSEYFAVPSSV